MAKRTMNRLTAQAVKKPKKPGLYPDGLNLYLSVQKGGTQSWAFRYTLSGKAHEMGLGPADHDGRNGGVTLARARLLAADARRLLLEGKDPLQERRRIAAEAQASAARATTDTTFEAVANEWFAKERPGWKNEKHATSVLASLKTTFPKLGKMDVASITVHLQSRATTLPRVMSAVPVR